MCINQTGDISTLTCSSLKLVDKFTYLGSSDSSTVKDINTQLARAWRVNDRLSVIWKSDLTDKIKQQLYDHQPPITKTIQVRRTRHSGHYWRSKDELISDIVLWPFHMDMQKQDDKLEHIYNSSVLRQHIALKTSQEQWTIVTGGERVSGRFLLVARHDDPIYQPLRSGRIWHKVNF